MLRGFSSITPTLFVLFVALLTPRPAGATTVADIPCAAPSTPAECVLERDVVVSSGATLDFGTRALTIARGGSLEVGAGTMMILTRSLKLQPGARLLGDGGDRGGTITVVVTEDIVLEQRGISRGRIDVSADSQGGEVELTAGRDIILDGDLFAKGKSLESEGGSLAGTAGRVLSVRSPIDASGGDGGFIALASGAGLSTTATLDVSASASGASGGAVELTSTNGNVEIGGAIRGEAPGSVLTSGGFGGELTVAARGGIVIAATVNFSGGAPEGAAGTVEFEAGGDLIQTGRVVALGEGLDGCASEDSSLVAGGLLTLDALVDVSGGACLGGSLLLKAGQAAMFRSVVNSDGQGNEILIEAPRIVVGSAGALGGNIHANAPPDGDGNIVNLLGCDISVDRQATINTSGSNGANLLQASGRMIISGSLLSRPGGENALEYLTTPPDLIGATIDPAPVITRQTTLRPCGVASPCGNGAPDADEECDDGNTSSCDGCSASCRRETCGNTRVDCGEQCDRGSQTSCDGDLCSATCQTERCGNAVRECTEECDLGDTVSGDGCDANCTTTRCGNGIVTPPEECDQGPTGGELCDASCRLRPPAGCGNGTVEPALGEECEGGCPACTPNCRLPNCGDGFRTCAEECDDDNPVCGDGCSPVCQIEQCGNLRLDCGEQCDEGTANGTGGRCSATCQDVCASVGRDCRLCANDTDCDPLGQCGLTVCVHPGADVSGICLVNPCDDNDLNTLNCLIDHETSQCEFRCLNAQVCSDGNMCNGTEVCTADGACAPGALPDCADSDPCSADSCDAANNRCVSSLPAGFDLLRCRLSTVEQTVQGSGADIKRPVRTKLSGLLRRLGVKVRKAEIASGKKRDKMLNAVARQLGKLDGVIKKALQRSQITVEVARVIQTATGGASQAVDSVRTP